MRSRRPFNRLWARLLPRESEIGGQCATAGAHAAEWIVHLRAAGCPAGGAGAAEMIAVQVRDCCTLLHRHALRSKTCPEPAEG